MSAQMEPHRVQKLNVSARAVPARSESSCAGHLTRASRLEWHGGALLIEMAGTPLAALSGLLACAKSRSVRMAGSYFTAPARPPNRSLLVVGQRRTRSTCAILPLFCGTERGNNDAIGALELTHVLFIFNGLIELSSYIAKA
jgi:hypothetical protein